MRQRAAVEAQAVTRSAPFTTHRVRRRLRDAGGAQHRAHPSPPPRQAASMRLGPERAAPFDEQAGTTGPQQSLPRSTIAAHAWPLRHPARTCGPARPVGRPAHPPRLPCRRRRPAHAPSARAGRPARAAREAALPIRPARSGRWAARPGRLASHASSTARPARPSATRAGQPATGVRWTHARVSDAHGLRRPEERPCEASTSSCTLCLAVTPLNIPSTRQQT